MRKKNSPTLLTLSAAAIAVLLSSPMLFLNVLLQPVQATSPPSSIQTRNPVALGDLCNVANTQITFNAQTSPSGSFTGGTFQITDINNSSQILWSGHIYSEGSGPDDDGGYYLVYSVDGNVVACGAGQQLWIDVDCGDGTSDDPNIILESNGNSMGAVYGTVDCIGGGGDTTTAQQSSTSSSSSPMTGTTTTNTTTQDSDGDRDGIPDSSDKCTHNSNPRCFKEGDASTTQQQSSSDRTGNQTR